MLKRCNITKKMSSMLMAAIVCATSAMSGYAAESPKNSDFNETRGIESVVDAEYDEVYSKTKAGRVATSTDATPSNADTILKDNNGYIISGKWECGNGIMVELADNVFTFSGTGELNIDMKNDIIVRTIYKNNKQKIKCVINSGITRIGDTAFTECISLSNIEIPNSVCSIGYGAFSYCTSLSSIEIPNSVSKIEACAFYGCSNLISIEIPSSVSKIEYRVFNGCSHLNSIKVAEDNKIYDSRENCNAIIETQTNTLIVGSNNTKIPNTVSRIGESAFNGHSNLKSIKIPSSVNRIDYLAFNGCTGLSSVEISNGVRCIYTNAFMGCSSLSSIEIPSSVDDIDTSAFLGCSNLSSIKVAEDNTSYDSRENCNAIIGTRTNTLIVGSNNTKIPNSVNRIERNAFNGRSNLSSIEIPSSISSIGMDAFNSCSNLSSIKVAEDNKIYDSRENCDAIIETQTNTLIIGSNNTKIPNSVSSIGENAFNGRSNLSSIEIPNSVTSIDCYAFRECSNLRSIEIPNSVSSIHSYAFYECSSLTKITNHSSQNFELSSFFIHNGGRGDWYLENTDTIVGSIANGQTAIYKPYIKYGDINSDGEINVQDGVLLKKHLAFIKGININIEACDVNADDTVNTQDAIILLKYLAGMKVTLGLGK